MEYFIKLFIRCAILLCIADPTAFALRRSWKTLKRYCRTKDPATKKAVREELVIMVAATIALFSLFCFFVAQMSQKPLEF